MAGEIIRNSIILIVGLIVIGAGILVLLPA